MRLSAGDRLVTIQQRPVTDEPGASGVPIVTWTTLRQVFMGRVDQGGGEHYKAASGLHYSSQETAWYAPYMADMDPELLDVPKLRRLMYQGRVFNVTGAKVVGNRHGIELRTVATP